MNKERFLTNPKSIPRGPNGERYCCYCRAEIPPKSRRQRWCSDKCVDDYRLRSDGQFLRAKVFERDKGICAACGVDTVKQREEILARGKAWEAANPFTGSYNSEAYEHCRDDMFRAVGNWRSFHNKPKWEADHIIEVVRGGGACGLENIQTLCLLCHNAKTARMARERAEQRQKDKQPVLIEL